mmetsp:Transcript_33111/g.48349  ORF Transcript_33111/g.48349 Transcript_33111/m.48349 type:complete len:116 (+) Transcript_33111:710-1057(+)
MNHLNFINYIENGWMFEKELLPINHKKWWNMALAYLCCCLLEEIERQALNTYTCTCARGATFIPLQSETVSSYNVFLCSWFCENTSAGVLLHGSKKGTQQIVHVLNWRSNHPLCL